MEKQLVLRMYVCVCVCVHAFVYVRVWLMLWAHDVVRKRTSTKLKLLCVNRT